MPEVARSGQRRTRSPPCGPSCPASTEGAACDANCCSGSTNGWYEKPMSWSHRPYSTVAPSECARLASSAANLVLPMPGSPPMTTMRRSPACRGLPRVGQAGQLGGPPGETELAVGSQWRRQRHRRALVDGGRRAPRHLVGGDRLGQSLQVEGAQGGQLGAVPAAGQHPHHLGHEDLGTLGRRAQPGRLDDRGAEAVTGIPGDIAGADADAHHLPAAGVRLPRVHRLLHLDGGGDCIGRAGEGREDPVAEALHDRPAAPLDDLDEESIVGLAEPVGRVLTDSGAQGRRPHQVGDEDGHRARALHGTSVRSGDLRRAARRPQREARPGKSRSVLLRSVPSNEPGGSPAPSRRSLASATASSGVKG